MVMRYQRISPDSVPISTGRRNNPPSNPNWKTCKGEENKVEIYGNLYLKTSSTFDGKGLSRFRSPSKSSQDSHLKENGNRSATLAAETPNYPPNSTSNAARNQQNLDSTGVGWGGGGGGGETLLQWCHRKRSRCSRGIITVADEATSSSTASGAAQLHSAKIQRRSSASQMSSSSSPNANLMPPPSILCNPPNGIHRGQFLKPQATNASSNASSLRGNLEERSRSRSLSSGGNKILRSRSLSNGSNNTISGRCRAGKRTPFLGRRNPSILARDDKEVNGCSLQHNQEAVTSDGNMNMNGDINTVMGGKLVAEAAAAGGGGGERVDGGGGEVNEWPRIYIPLSRKEKEEDFLAMKGTKLPQRPKKRPKAIDRIIQFCYPESGFRICPNVVMKSGRRNFQGSKREGD